MLFMEMDGHRYDVNVHPTKIEVRFAEDRLVYDALRRTVLKAFRGPGASPELKIVSRVKQPKQGYLSVEEDGAEQLTLDAQRPVQRTHLSRYEENRTEAPVFWQLHNRYILSQIKSGLTIIDQHVAHERILYERALASRKGSVGLSQQLLFAQVVTLDPEDYVILTDIVPYLEKIGFGLKEFGGMSIMIESVPVDIKPGKEQELLLEIIQAYKELRDASTDVWEAVAKSFACKSAIKSGERLSFQEMASLVDQLFATEEPYFCPHGRPIIVNLKLEELDRRFGR
jgi:DNA mismatch repair protein MutL